jgi:hypothetical protein
MLDAVRMLKGTDQGSATPSDFPKTARYDDVADHAEPVWNSRLAKIY